MAHPLRLLALHGFLGRGADWHFLREWASHQSTALNLCTPDLFSGEPSGHSLAEEARELWQQFREGEVAPGDRPILLGYSYGGRLATEMALQNPQAFSKLIFVSSGFGFADESKRREREVNDEKWALDFLNLEWLALLKKWNNLEVLAPAAGADRGQPGPRVEQDFNRARLAEALRLRSPATMPYQLPRLAALKMPVLLVVGEADAPYLSEAQRALEQLPNAQLEILKDASHRAPWQQKERFCQVIQPFIFS